MSNLVVQ